MLITVVRTTLELCFRVLFPYGKQPLSFAVGKPTKNQIHLTGRLSEPVGDTQSLDVRRLARNQVFLSCFAAFKSLYLNPESKIAPNDRPDAFKALLSKLLYKRTHRNFVDVGA